MGNDEEGLYELLEKLLMGANEPLDCNELFDRPEVRVIAASANRVSDYLGNIWRKGRVSRIPATNPGRGPRWKYQWKTKIKIGGTTSFEYAPKIIASRPTLVISEQGEQIQIEMAELTILIRQKKLAKQRGLGLFTH